MRLVLPIVLALLLIPAVQAADPEKAAKEFQEAKKAGAGALVLLKDDVFAKATPHQTFFTLRFRQFPVARPNPEGLSSSNVLVVDPQDKVQLIKDAKELEAFAKHTLTAKEAAAAKAAARTWLLLTSELIQDGFYKFQVPDDTLTVAQEEGKLIATGRLVVMQGGMGELIAQLTFDAAGKLTAVTEKNMIKPGPRPICQATLLLHPDPLVRRICEQDLLIMGTPAREYLMEQRAKASPELQQAIDRIWARIERGER
jgi:hypothetical protein